MDNRINFTGGFLLHKPTPKMWEKIYTDNLQNKKRTIINDLYEAGDVFFATRSGHDSNILKYLLNKRNLKFTFYPNVSTKNRFGRELPEEVIKQLDTETALTERKEIKKYIKPEPVVSPAKRLLYKWKPEDYIAQTFKALKLNPENYTTITRKHVTLIKHNSGAVVAKVSPNTTNGINYVYEYPHPSNSTFRMVIIDHNGNILDQTSKLEKMSEFNKHFAAAVKTDIGRTAPTKKS